MPLPDLTTDEGLLKTSKYVGDLGVTLDKHLTLQKHIKNVCKSASWGIYKIEKIRRLLGKTFTERHVQAFVSSNLSLLSMALVLLESVNSGERSESEKPWRLGFSSLLRSPEFTDSNNARAIDKRLLPSGLLQLPPGLPISHISPLQRIQNSAARLITLCRKHDQISPVLRSLHWLPVHSCIT